MSYNIFSDLHHFSLYNSLRLLFENRLGGKIYRPIGEEWLNNGYWRMAEIYRNHPATIAQYLGIRPDYDTPEPGLYLIPETMHQYDQKAITLDYFFNNHFDFVIASIPDHIESFRRLCDEHPDHPKLIYQIGNSWNIKPNQASIIDFVLASAKLNPKPTIPYIEYHQEFDLNLFKPDFKYYPPKSIKSFVNCFCTDQLFTYDWKVFQEVENLMLEWEFKALGGQCRNGSADGIEKVAQEMKDCKFVWHTKNYGDGYGHVIHNAFAMGKPPIVRLSYYEGKMAGELMRPGENCIAIDGLSIQEIVNKITYYAQPDEYIKLSHGAYNSFKNLVDFDMEATTIGKMLQKLYN